MNPDKETSKIIHELFGDVGHMFSGYRGYFISRNGFVRESKFISFHTGYHFNETLPSGDNILKLMNDDKH